jgi:hypothetical protein
MGEKRVTSPVTLRGVKSDSHTKGTIWIVGFGLKVLTAVTVKDVVFWDVTPCSPVHTAPYRRSSLQRLRTSENKVLKRIPQLNAEK